ncbi:MAG TPA: hypothetical protein PKD09_16155 [Aggregatilinea sp.]|uniref:hypothetical protein n=1 Tax=Aggregatilinea sp. TaxID=2806333 RepID=UPI002BF0D739|nr:hypothetical protein [Aggregatilinea sp.]HML23188.1 hypothetical protein [Aggregatilinea sp.]
MASNDSPNGRPRAAAPEPSGLFDAFPEPRGWAQNWDGSALGLPERTPPPAAIKVRFIRRG